MNGFVWLLKLYSTVARSLNRARPLPNTCWIIVLWTRHLLPLFNVHDRECVFDLLSVQRRWWLTKLRYWNWIRHRRVRLKVSEYSQIIICLRVCIDPIPYVRYGAMTIRLIALWYCLLTMAILPLGIWFIFTQWAFIYAFTDFLIFALKYARQGCFPHLLWVWCFFSWVAGNICTERCRSLILDYACFLFLLCCFGLVLDVVQSISLLEVLWPCLGNRKYLIPSFCLNVLISLLSLWFSLPYIFFYGNSNIQIALRLSFSQLYWRSQPWIFEHITHRSEIDSTIEWFSSYLRPIDSALHIIFCLIPDLWYLICLLLWILQNLAFSHH